MSGKAIVEPVVYLPAPGHPAMAGIAPRSGIVGEPRPGGEEVLIYYEGAIYNQVGMDRLADRVFHAHGRLRERYPTLATRVVPRDSLIVVGTFDPRGGRIILTGPHSEREVAAWLGTEWLHPAELLCSRNAA